ncbi:hypothetical protein DVH24_021257 [Malus domestica]|uniref:Uncharacterized protein n=1 Tax=Malus domestica TaxID=3750 RepID=A0A498HWY9_MALDO|nr:hypothetical protein DVH24_021257 [Malus domestica]
MYVGGEGNSYSIKEILHPHLEGGQRRTKRANPSLYSLHIHYRSDFVYQHLAPSVRIDTKSYVACYKKRTIISTPKISFGTLYKCIFLYKYRKFGVPNKIFEVLITIPYK